MNLVGQTICRNKCHVLIYGLKGDIYQCKEQETNRKFTAIKEVYDKLFLCVKTPLKKKGFKGKTIQGAQTFTSDDQ